MVADTGTAGPSPGAPAARKWTDKKSENMERLVSAPQAALHSPPPHTALCSACPP